MKIFWFNFKMRSQQSFENIWFSCSKRLNLNHKSIYKTDKIEYQSIYRSTLNEFLYIIWRYNKILFRSYYNQRRTIVAGKGWELNKKEIGFELERMKRKEKIGKMSVFLWSFNRKKFIFWVFIYYYSTYLNIGLINGSSSYEFSQSIIFILHL